MGRGGGTSSEGICESGPSRERWASWGEHKVKRFEVDVGGGGGVYMRATRGVLLRKAEQKLTTMRNLLEGDEEG